MSDRGQLEYTRNCYYYIGPAIFFITIVFFEVNSIPLFDAYFNALGVPLSKPVTLSQLRELHGLPFASIPLLLVGGYATFFSSRLDFIDERDDWFSERFLHWSKIFAICLGVVSVDYLFFRMDDGFLWLVLWVPTVVAIFMAGAISMAAFFIGLPCAHRAIIYLTVGHPLRETVQQGMRDGQFSEGNVVDSMGTTGASPSVARAQRKDLNELMRELREEVERREAELAKLSKSIEDDTARLEQEAEIATLMARLEETSLKLKYVKKLSEKR